MSYRGGARPGARSQTPANSTIRVDPSVARADTLAVAAQYVADRVGPTSSARTVSAAILWGFPEAIPGELVHTTALIVTDRFSGGVAYDYRCSDSDPCR